MALIYDFICLNCGKSFQSININAKYCSYKCFASHRKGRWSNPKREQREIRKCQTCQKEFECKTTETKKYCSHKCYWIGVKGSVKPELKNGRKYFCAICYKGFYRSKSSTRKYCSRECYLISHSKNVRDVNCATCGKIFRTSRKTKEGKLFCSNKCYFEDHSMIIEQAECPTCHKIFEQSSGLSEKKTFCSLECSNIFNTKNPERNQKIGRTLKEKYDSGEKISWSKGLTSENDNRLRKMSIKILESYQFGNREPHNKGTGGPGPYCDEWRDREYKQDILKRDNYTCQNPDCWHTSDHLSLCPHHINYDKRDCKPNNLISVCVSCNSRANTNREYWQNLYLGLINEKN